MTLNSGAALLERIRALLAHPTQNWSRRVFELDGGGKNRKIQNSDKVPLETEGATHNERLFMAQKRQKAGCVNGQNYGQPTTSKAGKRAKNCGNNNHRIAC